jgi:putative flippase GtrA
MKHWVFGPVLNGHIQFFRYVFVGGTAAVVNLVAYGFLTEGMAMHYLLAALIGYTVGFLWNYLFSLLWIFKSRHSRAKEIVMVVVITIGGLGWTELFLYLFVEYGALHHMTAMFITLWIVLFWNFGMRKLFVFH